MNIVEIAKKRYAAKAFDPNKKIPADKLQALKELLQLAPSSVNGQPWHFIISQSDEGKARFTKSTEGSFEFNKQKILDASLVLAFCARTTVDEAHLLKISDQEGKDNRFKTEEAKQGQHERRKHFVNLHKEEWKDLPHWTGKQVYLNLGTFLLGAAAMDLDAVPIEGFDSQAFDKEFNLAEQGLTSQVLVAVGYHSDEDFNKDAPKSRLPIEDIISEI